MDPLSDVLRAVRLNGAHFYLVEAGHSWAVSAAAARELVPRVLPDAEHLISYHICLEGECWGGLEGEGHPQVMLRPGDVIVFPQGDAHIMSSANGYRDSSGSYGTSVRRYRETVHLGPDDTHNTTLVCGFLGCDLRPYNPLLSSLPRQMLISGAADGWLSQFPRQVVIESRNGNLGADTLLTRMAELMFVEVVRRYVENLPQQTGWVAGLVDPVVAPALSKLHERPDYPWTLAELAKEIATSRTVLVDRFSRVVGVPPMLYLTRWRLQLAAEKLARGTGKVAAIGSQVGYESEAAFSRAFKRETGLSPAAWRRARQSDETTAVLS